MKWEAVEFHSGKVLVTPARSCELKAGSLVGIPVKSREGRSLVIIHNKAMDQCDQQIMKLVELAEAVLANDGGDGTFNALKLSDARQALKLEAARVRKQLEAERAK